MTDTLTTDEMFSGQRFAILAMFERRSSCTLQLPSAELFPLHNFQNSDCHCMWVYSFGIGEVWWMCFTGLWHSKSWRSSKLHHGDFAEGVDTTKVVLAIIVYFKPNTVYSSLFQPSLAYSSLFSLFQIILGYSSLISTHSAHWCYYPKLFVSIFLHI